MTVRFFITRDTHGDFDRIERFCIDNKTTAEDVLIILGDVGINHWCNGTDQNLKERLSQLEVTLFCLHGNHGSRLGEIGSYDEIPWRGGIVYVKETCPNILLAKEGETYDFNGQKFTFFGRAYSDDKGHIIV